jgi:broad specificity polyphosphatase/5'/3'-nucleotidase SurE
MVKIATLWSKVSKTKTAWSPVSKTQTTWEANTAYYTNQYPYDSATLTYDSAIQTYDGIVTGEQLTNNKPKTAWTNI